MLLQNQIESLLFISHKPLSLSEIARAVGAEKKESEEALKKLKEEYDQKQGGVELLNLEDKYQLATTAQSSEIIAKFLKTELTGELTRPSLETLTIVAYRGPISKAELELIRGVNCSLILRNLLIRGLIESREDKVKSTVVYNITFEFLKFLGLTKASDLPDYEKLNRNNNLDKLLSGLIGGAVEKEIQTETTEQI
ncbi:MAG: SMC-Scp complex subunit ScpB [Patescibacteria group bacterium]